MEKHFFESLFYSNLPWIFKKIWWEKPVLAELNFTAASLFKYMWPFTEYKALKDQTKSCALKPYRFSILKIKDTKQGMNIALRKQNGANEAIMGFYLSLQINFTCFSYNFVINSEHISAAVCTFHFSILTWLRGGIHVHTATQNVIWVKVFKNGPSKMFKSCFWQISIGPFLNTLTHISSQPTYPPLKKSITKQIKFFRNKKPFVIRDISAS